MEQLNQLRKKSETEFQNNYRNLSTSLRKESQHCEELRHFIATIKEELLKLTSAEESRAKELEELQSLKRSQANENNSELSKRVLELETTVGELQRKEKNLMLDMKKKGDLARQIISSREDEIRGLQLKLQQTLADINSTTPLSAIKAANIPASSPTQVALPSTIPQNASSPAQVALPSTNQQNKSIFVHSEEIDALATSPEENEVHRMSNYRGTLLMVLFLLTYLGPQRREYRKSNTFQRFHRRCSSFH